MKKATRRWLFDAAEELLLGSSVSGSLGGIASSLGSVASGGGSVGSSSTGRRSCVGCGSNSGTGGGANSCTSSGSGVNSSGSGSCRSWSFNRSWSWCRSWFFLLATSGQGGGGNQCGQYERFVHYKNPFIGGKNSRTCQRDPRCPRPRESNCSLSTQPKIIAFPLSIPVNPNALKATSHARFSPSWCELSVLKASKRTSPGRNQGFQGQTTSLWATGQAPTRERPAHSGASIRPAVRAVHCACRAPHC